MTNQSDQSFNIATSKFIPHIDHLEVSDGTTLDEWIDYAHRLQNIEGAIQWIIGDWLLWGERKFPDHYTQALNESQAHTWKVYAWVAGKIPKDMRHPNVTWSLHRLVANYPEYMRSKLLDKAHTENLTYRELVQFVTEVKNEAFAATTAKAIADNNGKDRDITIDDDEYERRVMKMLDDAVNSDVTIRLYNDTQTEFFNYFTQKHNMTCPHCGRHIDVKKLFTTAGKKKGEDHYRRSVHDR